MSTLLTIIGTAVIAAPIGFGICAALTQSKVADLQDDEQQAKDETVFQKGLAKLNGDACRINQLKLSAIRDLLDTPRTIRKGDVRDVLDGEQG